MNKLPAARKPPQTMIPAEVRLYEATEELRDLVSAMEWLLDMKPEDPVYEFERKRARMRADSAKELVTRLDREQGIRETALEGRLRKEWGADDDQGESSTEGNEPRRHPG